ncbi:hypothetical protein [Microvirga antarctica]|uniref:hypothetical protein n=1 Tax=Microvirga antarctica TaxID=2819233 RepID=UPI001B303FEF|nr:hypothetical protein [Microvirga antarctica]
MAKAAASVGDENSDDVGTNLFGAFGAGKHRYEDRLFLVEEECIFGTATFGSGVCRPRHQTPETLKFRPVILNDSSNGALALNSERRRQIRIEDASFPFDGDETVGRDDHRQAFHDVILGRGGAKDPL